MYVFEISANEFTYDTFDSATVIAKDSDSAIRLVQSPDGQWPMFEEWQLPLHIRTVCKCDAIREEILTTSFNAG